MRKSLFLRFERKESTMTTSPASIEDAMSLPVCEPHDALQAFNSLRRHATEFEKSLDERHEVGARLVSFGNAVSFQVQQIGYAPPNLISFDGVTEEGARVRLVQHVTQLSVLFIAMPIMEDKIKRPIGFVLPEELKPVSVPAT